MKASGLSWVLAVAGLLVHPPAGRSATATLLGWNDLGMHCMDADYSVFSILPPYNTIHAQLIRQGRLVTAPVTVRITYEAVADASGSIDRTSVGKTTFWQYANQLYLPPDAPALAPDLGLAGFAMPGAANTPQAMVYHDAQGWFSAEGIPITPLDDSYRTNAYPMFRLVARDTANNAWVASADIVLPVSTEMDCRACHASGSFEYAKPMAGWEWDCDPQRDYRFNILRVHDELNAGALAYLKALKEAGYETSGLYATAKSGTSILCARCHASNALPGTGQAGLPPLTQAVHGWHAMMPDPDTGAELDASVNRAACYRCHPGSETRCLRGVMGSAVAADGSRAMDCQSCHGKMSTVGADARRGWYDEPTCQQCHTGTATKNSGAIRFTSAFDAQGNPRTAADATFATDTDVPVPGAALFRFSRGHGGLYCSACHGSTHAEFPSAEPNDNVLSITAQGHAGMMAECTACHVSQPSTYAGGPHGLHPVGSAWISSHDNAAAANLNGCRTCHGQDLRGTVLSRALANRSLSVFGGKQFWRGFQIGCYTCHNGPNSDDRNPNQAAVVSNQTLAATAGQPASLTLPATDADGNPLTLRIVTQPAHGTVALANRTATYAPEPGFVGSDGFTFAAWDGSTDSNLGQVAVTVAPGPCQVGLAVKVPTEVGAGSPVPFRAQARLTGCGEPLSYEWSWSDGAAPSPAAEACREFSRPGTVQWQVKATAGATVQTLTGTITVKGGAQLSVTLDGTQIRIAWPAGLAGYVLETTAGLVPALWLPEGSPPVQQNGQLTVTIPVNGEQRYFRLRQGP